MKVVKIVINEEHRLLKCQHEVLEKTFGRAWYEYIQIPAGGMTAKEQVELAGRMWEEECDVVVVSPAPVLLTELVKVKKKKGKLYVFVNDKREKIEKDGRILLKLPADGWYLWEV